MQNWVQWEERLPEQLTVPRSLAVHQEEVQSIELHAFGDASGKGVAAAVYAVVVHGTCGRTSKAGKERFNDSLSRVSV